MGLLKVVWKSICELTKEIETYTGASIKRSNEQLKAIQNSKVAEFQTAIYLAQNSGTETVRKFSFLTAYISKKKGNHSSEKDSHSPGLKSVAHATYLKGNLEEFFNVMAATKGNTTTTMETATASEISGTACNRKLSETSATYLTNSVLSEQGFDKLLLGMDDANKKQASDTVACNILQGGANKYGTTVLDNTLEITAGYVTVATSDTTATLEDLTKLSNGGVGKPAAFVNLFNARKGIETKPSENFKNTTGKPT
uniref:Variant surface glycoprotein 1125.5752 n=1 Tax=Trypanosoma brucei TaxID=5691 RepID=A0A1J0RDH9_9TRYP|nr:variant surface glycoprotein 1125.5752 [Trypanosoma brucei]